jgi:hypothetical protein
VQVLFTEVAVVDGQGMVLGSSEHKGLLILNNHLHEEPDPVA